VVNGVIYRRRAHKFLRAAVMGLLPEAVVAAAGKDADCARRRRCGS